MFRKIRGLTTTRDPKDFRLLEMSSRHDNVASWAETGFGGHEINPHFGFDSRVYVQDGFRCLGIWGRA